MHRCGFSEDEVLATDCENQNEIECIRDLISSSSAIKWYAREMQLRYNFRLRARYGRYFGKTGRFVPTSQTCPEYGQVDGPKPLHVREWVCAGCGAVHDRDVNAAKNVLAAGQADRVNACGALVRPGLVPAPRCEAGTRRGDLPSTDPAPEGAVGIPAALGRQENWEEPKGRAPRLHGADPTFTD
jgi:putative transposase